MYMYVLHVPRTYKYMCTYVQMPYRRIVLCSWLRTLVSESDRYEGPALATLDQYSSIASVERWRIPRSTTTLTWTDGGCSRLFTTVADSLCSRDQLQKLQKRFSKAMHLETTGNSSHMWSAQTTISFLQFLSAEPWVTLCLVHFHIF